MGVLPAGPDADDFFSSPTQPKRFSAWLAVLFTLLLSGSVLGLLFYRGATIPAPSRVIVVRGSSDWKGADLLIEGGNLNAPQSTTILSAGNYIVPFFLEPGVYMLRVKSQGVEVYSREFDMTTEKTREIDLTRTGAATLPSTAPTSAEAGSP